MENEDIGLETIDLTKIPITTGTFSWFPLCSLLYIMLHILSFMMPGVMILTFYTFAMDSTFYHWRMYLIFIDVLAWWGAYIILSLILAKLFLLVLKLLHTPKEGLFKVDKKDRDYYYFCLRVTVKKYVFWVWNNFCFPWAANLAFKACDMTADFKSTMYDGWTDLEFIEFGNNMMIGQGALIMSSIIIRIENVDYLMVKKVIIGDHVVVGGHSIVTPGTIIGKGTTLGVWAVTHVGQVLEPNWIYIGKPAMKYQPSQKALEESKKIFVRRIVDTGERVPFDINYYAEKENEKNHQS